MWHSPGLAAGGGIVACSADPGLTVMGVTCSTDPELAGVGIVCSAGTRAAAACTGSGMQGWKSTGPI